MEYITALKKFVYLSNSNEQKLVVKESENDHEDFDGTPEETIPEADIGLTKALETYRKLIEKNELTDRQQETLENRLKEIQNRDIIETDTPHSPIEIPVEKGKIKIGPPVLTRFEKARIMGARALQLSLGAPPFIPIPKTARISLDIAMVELDERVIPITIRRVLPNGNFQNIPIDYFK